MRHQGHNRLTWSAGLPFDAIRLKLCGVTSPMMHSTLAELDRIIARTKKKLKSGWFFVMAFKESGNKR